MNLNDLGRTVLFAVILGAALTIIAIMRGNFDIAGILAALSFATAVALTISARTHRSKP